ncbi:ADM isoform X1 [Rhinopithecus roxellana]|uniref:ADM isoform X1 n=1 Tax=Rhinopithecus roxellana TaxID=61622 RepID=UPI00053344D9|nr:ADM isoform X1 [Rhinopithecus roxellana]XP_017703445.1 PREDICTED: ADM isoform X1 [Rhinopithecus bieti]
MSRRSFERSESGAAPSPVLVPGRQGELTIGPEGLEVNGSRDRPGHRLNARDSGLLVFSRWNKWALSRGKRELRMSSSYPTGLADVKAGPAQTLIRPQDMKGASRSPEDSSPDAARIRVKRYRQSMNNFQGLRSFGCRFGTCTVQKLAHQIYQFTDKDKDNVAPRSKISPQGYGRRRRRSLPEAGPGRTLMSSKPQAPGAPVPPSGSAPHFL